jgi:disulfide bond formation protein DsbB
MSLSQAKLFFALLSVLANLLVIGYLVVVVGARFSPVLARSKERMYAELERAAAPLALVIALAATLGSLYLSEIAELEPCRLCWYQRIAMYPLVVVFLVGWLRRDRNVWLYGFSLSVVGGGIALWHYLVQWFPSVEAGSCQFGVPCSAVYFRELGFMSIPYMALSGFVAIAVLCLTIRRAPLPFDPATP